ncbi:MAG TPA: helix-turn-helix domain-containing protein [Candidatus Lachnoclostridium stercoravium]|uniref:Helix-turn-helix domain-containing protein n=1 Tax=Candidatus Lachnoclostridium stercoravium TaxID=2838633 RepID=A0A9D2HIT6_9FIRM|nr:helix-turn-helix domain-containing protein [Candidatus Lachnoclostridium stercoravium]
MLEQLDGSDSPIGKPERKYPYPEGTKFANKIIVKQTILSEADKAGVENMYRNGMSMSDIARIYNCHYTTIGRILRRRNVPIR